MPPGLRPWTQSLQELEASREAGNSGRRVPPVAGLPTAMRGVHVVFYTITQVLQGRGLTDTFANCRASTLTDGGRRSLEDGLMTLRLVASAPCPGSQTSETCPSLALSVTPGAPNSGGYSPSPASPQTDLRPIRCVTTAPHSTRLPEASPRICLCPSGPQGRGCLWLPDVSPVLGGAGGSRSGPRSPGPASGTDTADELPAPQGLPDLGPKQSG